jgi:hypothetical protein
MKQYIPTFESFVNEAFQDSESILQDLGFIRATEYRGGNKPMHFGSQGPVIKDESWVHPNMPNGYAFTFLGSIAYKYDGFAIFNGDDMFYIWKQSTTNANLKSNMNKALDRVAKDLSKGKLPKSNPEQIKKHYNS